MSLKLQRCYGVGAMDRVKDGGVGWRKDLTPFLESLGVIFLDPSNKPGKNPQEEFIARQEINELKKQRRFKEIRKIYGPRIRNLDMHFVDISNFLIVNYDVTLHLCGTQEEIFWANRCKKPVLFHFEDGLDSIPNWIILAFPSEYFFDSWDKLKDYVRKVNDGYDDSEETGRVWYQLDHLELTNKALQGVM